LMKAQLPHRRDFSHWYIDNGHLLHASCRSLRWRLLAERWTGARFDVPSTRNCSLQWLARKPSPRWVTSLIVEAPVSGYKEIVERGHTAKLVLSVLMQQLIVERL